MFKIKNSLHPFLFAIYPTVFLLLANLDQASLQIAIWPFFVSLITTGVLGFLINLRFKDWLKSSLITTVIVILFFTYGHFHSFIYGAILQYEIDHGINKGVLYQIRVHNLNILLGLIWFSLLFYLSKLSLSISNEKRKKINQFLNVTAMTMIALAIINVFSYSHDNSTGDDALVVHDGGIKQTISNVGYNPDIYYIILDGYAREDILKKYYNFNNKPFLSSLEKREFYISPSGYSNYFWTYLSLASSLNMQHVNFLKDKIGAKGKSRIIPYRMIRNNHLSQFLKKKGYKFLHLNSTWGATKKNPFADKQLFCSHGVYQNEFYRVLAETTWLKALNQKVTGDLAQCWKNNIETLKSIATEQSPKFVFAHFVPPHHPYLFDKNGKVLLKATVSNQFQFQKNLWTDKAGYIEQLQFVNKTMLEIVDQIFAQSKNKPIILIQSDHGPHVEWAKKRKRKDLRFANLNAFYLPQKNTSSIIPPDATPVNHFRRILNAYFETNLELLPPRHYYSSYHKPYNFKLHKVTK